MRERRVRLRVGGRAVEAVEAFEPGAAVVGSVGAVPVADELAGELQLVGRVVREEPRRGRLPQADLQRDRRQQQGRADDECRDELGLPGQPPEHRPHGERDDEHARQHRERPQRAEIPFAVGRTHDRPEQPVRMHRAGPERPRVGPEHADVQRDDDRERAEHEPVARIAAAPLRRRPGRGIRLERALVHHAAHGCFGPFLPRNATRSPFSER